jgi:1-pyrroline-5-carboxylate dehydrogenase
MGAVIDANSFAKIRSYIQLAQSSADVEILAGGGTDDKVGYFVEPTIAVTQDPHHRLMEEEVFGPLLTVFVYPDGEYQETLRLCDETSPYALTGAVFAQDREAVHLATQRLRHSAGNFYINDKPTGAVVGMQPFGGGRASGTNDKAGSAINLERWATPRTIKESFCPPIDFRYPYMSDSKR